MSLWKWSRTAASNSTADPTINYAEGQSPGSLNDSGRAAMAAVAKYRDDVAGIIATGGTSTAYTVTSYQTFDTLAHMDGACIAFVPHTTNGDTVTLNVDSLGAKPLRRATGVELVSGMLVAGTPYTATYNNSNAEWVLKSFFGNPYNIPLAGLLVYAGPSAPNSSFAFPFGQAISRTTYSTLFDAISTSYGAGNGSTTFNLPDLRGRVPVGKDDMGGSAANRITSAGSGVTGNVAGSTGGSQTHSLIIGELPNLPISASLTNPSQVKYGSLQSPTQGGGSTVSDVWTGTSTAATTGGGVTASISGTSGTSSGAAYSIVQPSIILNYIMRIL